MAARPNTKRKFKECRDLVIWPWVDSAQTHALTGASRALMRRWRVNGLLTEGIHWVYAPKAHQTDTNNLSNPRVLWNRDLMRSWIACGGDQNHPAQQRAIEAYLKSLPCTAI
jgi:hypothetical protein